MAPALSCRQRTAHHKEQSRCSELLLSHAAVRAANSGRFRSYPRVVARAACCLALFRPKSGHARKLVVRRTSEHWWEDEEEFDAITEVVVPKRLHLAVLAPAAVAGSGGGGTPATAAAAAGEGSWTFPQNDETLDALLATCGGKFACGFSSTQHKDAAEALWRRLRQAGPPFFKKIRTRAAIDVLEDAAAGPGAVTAAAEEMWQELCGQTWRVELDYGLEGAEAEPRDELLLACSGLAVSHLLRHAGLSADDEATRHTGVFVVHVSGYNASEQGGGGSEAGFGAPGGWRDLRPRLQPLAVAGAQGAAAVA